MSRSALVLLSAEDRGSLGRPACWHCRHRKECPYSRDRVSEKALERAVSQGQATAQYLMAEARRLLEEISGADDTCSLLRADEALEHVLSHILYAEIDLIKCLSGYQ